MPPPPPPPLVILNIIVDVPSIVKLLELVYAVIVTDAELATLGIPDITPVELVILKFVGNVPIVTTYQLAPDTGGVGIELNATPVVPLDEE